MPHLSPMIRRVAGALVLVPFVLGACGSTPGAPASNATARPSGATSADTAAPSATSGSAASSGAGAPASGGSAAGGPGSRVTDLCKVFSDAEITTFLGRAAHGAGKQAATTPDNCTWQDDSLTTVWLLRSDPDTCASDKEAIGSASISGPGVDFAGPSQLGAVFAGVTVSGVCYEIEVTPTERSPKPEALAGLLAQFEQRAGG